MTIFAVSLVLLDHHYFCILSVFIQVWLCQVSWVWKILHSHIDSVNYVGLHVYWAKVLTDQPKICDNCFVVKYFETNFGTLNENAVWHQSCAWAGIWHSSCSLRWRVHIKPLKCTCNSRKNLYLNSNHRNVNKKTFLRKIDNKLSPKYQNIWRKTILKIGVWQCFRRGSCHSVK